MRPYVKPVVILLCLALLTGVIVISAGLIPVSGSSGHWRITSWFLELILSRSIHTYSLGVQVPELQKQGMIVRGAGHYEIGCKICHGYPGALNFLGQQMSPEAPKLERVIIHWNDKELYQIVKHGIKFTAMPAWPSQERDDEVWSMVAFLKQLPKMTKEEYEQMVFHQSNEELTRTCANCHGADGNAHPSGAYPKIAGQSVEYLSESLKAYSTGKRHSGTMQMIASSLDEKMIKNLATYYNSKSRSANASDPDQIKSIERGRKIAIEGIPGQRVATCVACHGPYSEEKTKNVNYPELSGQYADYIELQLKLFIEKKRGGSKYALIMHEALSHMTNEQIKDVSLYYQFLNQNE